MLQDQEKRLYRVSGWWEDYTNYGILQDLWESVGNIFPLHMDTWYFDDAYSPVGHMDLGEYGMVEQLSVGAFLTEQVHAFGEAFTAIVRLHTDATVYYRRPDQGIRTFHLDESVDQLPEIAKQLPDSLITGLIVRFDVLATLRGPDGYIGDLWLRNVGALQLSIRIPAQAQQRAALPHVSPWMTTLHLDIVSLFLPDNQATLLQTRNEWKRLREVDPTVTIDSREDSPAPPVVTLVDPPPSTPLNNQELYEKNGPRLAQAISAWEGLTGHPFMWK
jgi:hypothetical protein